MNKDYLGTCAIDSLKLSFDTDKVDILNTELLNHIINVKIDTITGEIISETPIQQNSLKHQYEDYQIHFAINKHFGEEKLVVLLNSKLLEENYMDGISMGNIETVYKRVIEAKVFHISFEDFINFGTYSDIDIKKDVEFDSVEEFSNVIRILDNATAPQRRKDKGSNPFDKKDNKGIEWNKRTTSTFSSPFLKIYHKGIESKNGNNALYFGRYIDTDEIKNVVRIEATISNFTKQGSKYGIEDNRLVSILKLKSNELNNIIVHSVTSNLEARIKRPKKKTLTEYTPSDMVFYKLMYLGIQDYHSIESIIDYAVEDMEAVSKSRMKKKLITIYESEIEASIEVRKSKNLTTFFSNLGWK